MFDLNIHWYTGIVFNNAPRILMALTNPCSVYEPQRDYFNLDSYPTVCYVNVDPLILLKLSEGDGVLEERKGLSHASH